MLCSNPWLLSKLCKGCGQVLWLCGCSKDICVAGNLALQWKHTSAAVITYCMLPALLLFLQTQD